MDIDLTNLTEEQLLELNRRIIERLRFLRQARSHEVMADFQVGDRVSFQPDRGPEVVGTVVRLNRRTVTVVASDGHPWRVSPSLLRKASAEASPGANLSLPLLSIVPRGGRGQA